MELPRNRNEPTSSSSSTETMGFQEFIRLHDEAFAVTREAQAFDVDQMRERAFNTYQRALQLIDKAVSIANSGGFTHPGVEDKVLKMRMTRKEILERVSDLQDGVENHYLTGPSGEPPAPSTASTNPRSCPTSLPLQPDPDRMPPTYDEAQAMAAASGASFYGTLNAALEEIANEQAALANPLPLNAQEIFTIQEDVQVYFIGLDGSVSAPSYPTFLRIVTLQDQKSPSSESYQESQPPAFLQVADWTYPLIAGQSPVLRSAEGTYLFPDFTTTTPGSSVGLILPQNLERVQRECFEEILLSLCGLTSFPEPSRSVPIIPVAVDEASASTRMSTKISEGAESIAKGLTYGATKTSLYLDKGTAYLQSKLQPAQQSPNISPGVISGVKTAKYVTGKAVQVSGFIVNQVGSATVALSKTLAPHVQKASTKLIAKTTNANEAEASRTMDNVMEVAGGAVAGFGTVYLGLESAGKTLASSLANNTVTIVKHRYGEEAGDLTGDATSTAGNAAMTVWNSKGLGPKSLAKKAAKETGKAILKNHKDKKSPPGPSSEEGKKK